MECQQEENSLFPEMIDFDELISLLKYEIFEIQNLFDSGYSIKTEESDDEVSHIKESISTSAERDESDELAEHTESDLNQDKQIIFTHPRSTRLKCKPQRLAT